MQEKPHYFIGNDPKKRRTNVMNYAKMRYEGVYPGSDLVYYGNQRQLEYDFVVPLVEKILTSGLIPESQLQAWAEVLGHELNHCSRDCLHGQVACRVFQDAKPALKAYTLRKRREIFDWINELTSTLIQVAEVRTQRQAETARRRTVETWLQRNGVISIPRNKEGLPIFHDKTAHN